MKRINSGEMPPRKDMKQTSAAEIAHFVTVLMKKGESSRMAARYHMIYNRLTRDEQVNSTRDRLRVQYDAK